MAILFRQTKDLERRIDEFLDLISEAVILFRLAIHDFLVGNADEFEAHRAAINQKEDAADGLRREIESRLYTQSLIPEHRGDVLGLLEHLDDVIDTAKETVNQFSVEHPEIPARFDEAFETLARTCAECTESLVASVRAFFKNINAVQDHLHKVYFFEKEADNISDRLKREIFSSDLELARKNHLRYFAHHVDQLADFSESVADRLAIYTIKRTV